jgi:hypothetical protein
MEDTCFLKPNPIFIGLVPKFSIGLDNIKETMRQRASIFGILFPIIFALIGQDQLNDFPVLKGPYLGQKPPGMTPEIFAPGIVSTGYSEAKAVFSPDGRELYYQLWDAPFPVIVMMQEKTGCWTKPEIAPFSGQIIEGYNISPDGKKMFITSHRPLDSKGGPDEKGRIWVSEKSDGDWGKLRPLKPSIFGYLAVAESGNLYLATGDIWLSEFINGDYAEMEKIGDSINTDEYWEEDPYIAPDESFILFCRRDDGFGSWDIFVSFRRDDGTWTEAKNMGGKINSSASEVYPFVTPDGKFFFFSSRRTIHKSYSETPITYEEKIRILNSPGNGNADIYWVDARIIQDLKPDELKWIPSAKGDSPFHDWPVLRGPYFGQRVPTGKAEVFLDGIISNLNEDEMCAAFTADSREFYYNACHEGNWTIFVTKEVDGQWTQPSPLPITASYTDRDFTMSPDGNKIFFGSNRPPEQRENSSRSLDIFVTERLSSNQWSEPKNVGHPVNPDRGENYPSVARNGNLYFFSNRESGFGGCDIFVSRWENGHYSVPENLGSAVNCEKNDWDAFIAPDESFVIFSSQDREDSIGAQDLYISFRSDSGGWTLAKNMGSAVNSSLMRSG